MKKRLLPIPLILLIPIVLLVVVASAGIYRFSLSDEEILAKFPSSSVRNDAIMLSIFSIRTQNPWTIKVPNSSSFTFIDRLDEEKQQAMGSYIDGEVRGNVLIDTASIVQASAQEYVGVIQVTTQGSGVYHYLSLFKYDEFRQRMVLSDSVLMGDRVVLDEMNVINGEVKIVFRKHSLEQAMVEIPNETTLAHYNIIEHKFDENQSD